MYNWSTDTTKLKNSPSAYTIWKLEQLVNYGLNGEKLKRSALLRHWSKLHLDPKRKRVLELWLK